MDRGLLARATSADDGPTPGYLYGEIAKMTRASFDVCAKVEEYLAKRCSNKNANVKLKALVVIRHVAEKGAPQFKQQMVRRLPVIKDCQQFSGPPDPLRGDEPYRKVRVAAKDAIEALTSDDYEQPAQSMQGFSGGGDAYNDGPANYPPQRGRMEGFGNSIPEAEPTTYMAKAQRMASQMAEKAASRLQKSDSGYRGGDQRRSAEFSSHRSMPGVGNPRFGDARNAPPSGKSASRRARARPPTPSRRCGSGPRPPSRSTRPTTTLPIGARTRTAAGPSRRLLLHQARTGATGGAGMWAAAGGTRTRPSRLQGRARRPTKRIRQLNRRRRAARAAPRRTASTRDTW